MTLAIFDLDNTLLAGDSDYQWGQFLAKNGIVDRKSYEKKNTEFYEQYKAGTLDIMEFLNFSLSPLAAHSTAQLNQWRENFIEEQIRPILLPAAFQLVEKHRNLGHKLLVITATNEFITSPIVRLYGIDNLIATVPEVIDGQYTGRVAGTPSFQEGKVERLNQWLKETDENLDGSWFYSDSRNDIPLLEKVTHPVAVDPDETLTSEAISRKWPIISLREPKCDADFLASIHR